MSDQQKRGLKTINREKYEAEQRAKEAERKKNMGKGIAAMHAIHNAPK